MLCKNAADLEVRLKTFLLNIKVAKKQNVSRILYSIVSIFNCQKNLFCVTVTVIYYASKQIVCIGPCSVYLLTLNII